MTSTYKILIFLAVFVVALGMLIIYTTSSDSPERRIESAIAKADQAKGYAFSDQLYMGDIDQLNISSHGIIDNINDRVLADIEVSNVAGPPVEATLRDKSELYQRVNASWYNVTKSYLTSPQNQQALVDLLSPLLHPGGIGTDLLRNPSEKLENFTTEEVLDIDGTPLLQISANFKPTALDQLLPKLQNHAQTLDSLEHLKTEAEADFSTSRLEEARENELSQISELMQVKIELTRQNNLRRIILSYSGPHQERLMGILEGPPHSRFLYTISFRDFNKVPQLKIPTRAKESLP